VRHVTATDVDRRGLSIGDGVGQAFVKAAHERADGRLGHAMQE